MEMCVFKGEAKKKEKNQRKKKVAKECPLGDSMFAPQLTKPCDAVILNILCQ